MNAKYNLTTPITVDFVTEDNLSTLAKDGIKTLIEDEAIRRHALETAARQTVKPVAPPPPPMPTPVVPVNEWPKKLVVEFTLKTEEQYQIIQDLLNRVPGYILWSNSIRKE